MKPTSITTLAAILLVGAGAFMAGRISSPTTAAATGDGPAETKSSRTGSENADHSALSAAARKAARTEHSESSAERLSRLDSIIRNGNPLDRNRALLAYIDQLGPADFQDAIARFRSLGMTESRMGEYSLLLSAWAKADPLAALDYAKANTGSRFATTTILTTWASIDPEAAIQWAQANHQGDGANPYLAGIIAGLGSTDPARATQLLTGMPRSRERGDALDAMLPNLLNQGEAATRDWIAGIKDDTLRNGAISRSAEALARIDPAGTAAWLLANPGEGSQRSLDNVYGVWARQNQQAAVSSIATLPPGDDRSNALRGVVSSVATQDPAAAVAIMNSFPNDVNDHVLQNFVWHSFENDPATAVSQIARISNEGQRNMMYYRTLDNWMQRDPAAASAWVKTNPVPPAIVQKLNARPQ